MLWEVSVLNKIYKTNIFSKIKPRAYQGKPVYVLTEDNKFSSAVLEYQPSKGERLSCDSDEKLLSRFGIDLPHNSSNEYLQNLNLYDCILELLPRVLNGSKGVIHED